MYKFAKSKDGKETQSDIWAEGAQYAPLNGDALVRAGAILARRTSARVWTRASALSARFAIALEDGFGRALVTRLGRAAVVLPPRPATAEGFARFSRLSSQAAERIDHRAVQIAPLEFADLRSFMDRKREEALQAAAVLARKQQIALAARQRAASAALRAASKRKAPLSAAPDSADLADAAPEDAEHLKSIRGALAAFSLPDIIPAAPQPVVEPAPPRRPAPRPEDTATQRRLTRALRPEPRGLAARLAPAARLARRTGRWALRRLWALAGPPLTLGSGWLMAWGMFVLMLPAGLLSALRLHWKGQDLRYFD